MNATSSGRPTSRRGLGRLPYLIVPLIVSTLCLAVFAVQRGADYLSPGLRGRVEALKDAAVRDKTNAENLSQRVDTLWDWANAYALAGRTLPVNLPQAVAVARTVLAQEQEPAPEMLGSIDAYIHELSLQDEAPETLGVVRLSATEPLVAGSRVTLEQTYTVGSRPIEPGGKIVVAKQLATDQERFQATDPAAPNYVSIHSSDPAVRFARTEVVLLGMHGAFRGSVPTLAFEVEGAPLETGDVVTVVYGDTSGGSPGFRIQTFSTDELLLPLYVDLDGGGVLLSPEWPSLEVIGREVERATVFAPSVVRPGEPFTLSLRAEDRWWNRASGPVPAFEVRLDGEVVGRVEAGRGPVAVVRGLVLEEPGVARFEAVSADGRLRATSNPVWVRAEGPRILWGETHVHGSFAEGQGSPEAVYRYAREDARLDFLGYSEHDVWMDDAEWATMQRLAREHGDDDALIAFLGYEWTVSHRLGGHHNVFYRDLDRNRVPIQEAPLLPDLYRGLAREAPPEDVLVIPHAHEAADWTRSDPGLERLVEIYSMHGSFEFFGNRYLENGWEVGFIAASDDHRAKPGHAAGIPALGPLMQYGGLAAVLAEEKTRNAVFDALRSRAAYATSGQRMLLDARLNGRPMGTRQPEVRERLLTAEVMGTAPIESIDVVKNGDVVLSRRYLTAPLRDDSWLQVGFESSTEVAGEEIYNPRAWRRWHGSIRVEGARVLGVETPGLDNLYEEYARVDADDPSLVHFHVDTRGRLDTLLLRLAGVTSSTALTVHLEERREFDLLGGKRRPAALMPARVVELPLAELRDGRLERQLRHGTDTDRITLQPVERDGPLDRSFEYRDLAESGAESDTYYVRITQLDGARAWSSPFWAGGE